MTWRRYLLAAFQHLQAMPLAIFVESGEATLIVPDVGALIHGPVCYRRERVGTYLRMNHHITTEPASVLEAAVRAMYNAMRTETL